MASDVDQQVEHDFHPGPGRRSMVACARRFRVADPSDETAIQAIPFESGRAGLARYLVLDMSKRCGGRFRRAPPISPKAQSRQGSARRPSRSRGFCRPARVSPSRHRS